MKKTLLILCSFLVYSNLCAQLLDPILRDTMTLSQAKYQLQREMATISYYYFQDYYGQQLGDRFKYSKKFSRESKEFEMLPTDSILHKIKNKDWRIGITHTNRDQESTLYLNHNVDGADVNIARIRTPRSFKKSFIPKEIYYYGSEERDPNILKTDRWYKNRKCIDSMLVDYTIYYPTEIKTILVPIDSMGKVSTDNGGFIQQLNSPKDNYLDVAATSDIVENMAYIGIITKDGTRYISTNNTYTPKQPSTPMFSYANTCYAYCKELIHNIDDGKYKSIKELIKEFDKTRPTPPSIQWLYRYGFDKRDDIQSFEFKYFTKYDSITKHNLKAYDFIPRKGDYVVVEKSTGKRIIRGIADKNGKWIIRPNDETIIVDEVAGIFYNINSRVDYTHESDQFVYVDEPKKRFVRPYFELVKNIKDTFLLVEKDELYGVVSREGTFFLPIKYSVITYNDDWGLFVVKLNTEKPQYQLFSRKGKPAIDGVFRLIEFDHYNISVTQIKDDKEVVTVYNRKLKPIKKESSSYYESTEETTVLENDVREIINITENLKTVEKKHSMGVRDIEDNIIIPMKYLAILYDPSTDLITAISHNRKYSLFYTNGKSAMSGEFRKIETREGFIYVTAIHNGEEVTSLYNKKLKQINPKNTSVESLFNLSNEPVLAIDGDGHQFFMAINGKKVLPHSNTYRYLDGFYSDRALCTPRRFAPMNRIYGFIAPDGNMAIPFIYTKANSFRGEYAYVEDGDKAFFITTENKIFKELPSKAKFVHLFDTPENTRYYLTNGDVYDGNINLVN